MNLIEIRRQADNQPIEVMFAPHQLRSVGHLIKMPSNRLPLIAMHGKHEDGRLSVGRHYMHYQGHMKATQKCVTSLPTALNQAVNCASWHEACKPGTTKFQEGIQQIKSARSA